MAGLRRREPRVRRGGAAAGGGARRAGAAGRRAAPPRAGALQGSARDRAVGATGQSPLATPTLYHRIVGFVNFKLTIYPIPSAPYASQFRVCYYWFSKF